VDVPLDGATWNQRHNDVEFDGQCEPTSAPSPVRTRIQRRRGEAVYTTIAWATDGSPSALNALTVATGMARQYGAKLAVIHVEEALIGRGAMFVDRNEAAVAALHRTAQQLRDEGIDTTVSVSRAPAGNAAETIIHLAADAGADMIVVGNRGHGPFAGLVLGSVALQLLRATPYPILMVPSRNTSEAATAVADAMPDASLARA
jgi:nucleotide-binding universal stress UspA family protein